MEQQSAIRWLIEKLNQCEPMYSGIKSDEHLEYLNKLFEQAKQMEKEQISKAWDDGDYAYFYSKETGRDFDNGEEYYNEKFKTK
jgi:hypothetical protein